MQAMHTTPISSMTMMTSETTPMITPNCKVVRVPNGLTATTVVTTLLEVVEVVGVVEGMAAIPGE